ncbi:MAG: hypothetical protein CMF37_15540 [Leeuwenhoekiella sp.]|nr:hypothetical protein [Leeuwenhoekiella sp.]MBH14326.1 hypothetical protein [Leeuwenhoekiella sp.]
MRKFDTGRNMSDPVERIHKALKIVEKQTAIVPQEDITFAILRNVDSKFHDHVLESQLGLGSGVGYRNQERLEQAGWIFEDFKIITTKGKVNIPYLMGKKRKQIKKLLASVDDDPKIV